MPTDSAGLCGTKNFEDLALDQLDPPVHETGQLVDPVQDGAQLHRRTPFLVEAGAPHPHIPTNPEAVAHPTTGATATLLQERD